MPAQSFGASADEWAKRSFGLFHLLYHWKPQLGVDLTHLESDSTEASEAVAKFGHMMRFQLFYRFRSELQVPLSCTESPIEELLLLALTVVASNDAEVVFRVDGKEYGLARV